MTVTNVSQVVLTFLFSFTILFQLFIHLSLTFSAGIFSFFPLASSSSPQSHLSVYSYPLVVFSISPSFFYPCFFNLLIVLFVFPSGTLLRRGGRPGVPVAPSGGNGETADVWWSQRARRGDCGNLLADVGQPWRRHTRTPPPPAALSRSTAAAAATGELWIGNQCFDSSFSAWEIEMELLVRINLRRICRNAHKLHLT